MSFFIFLWLSQNIWTSKNWKVEYYLTPFQPMWSVSGNTMECLTKRCHICVASLEYIYELWWIENKKFGTLSTTVVCFRQQNPSTSQHYGALDKKVSIIVISSSFMLTIRFKICTIGSNHFWRSILNTKHLFYFGTYWPIFNYYSKELSGGI